MCAKVPQRQLLVVRAALTCIAGAPDPFVHFRGYFRQCAAVGDQDRRQTFLESAIHSYVKHQHRLGSDHNATVCRWWVVLAHV